MTYHLLHQNPYIADKIKRERDYGMVCYVVELCGLVCETVVSRNVSGCQQIYRQHLTYKICADTYLRTH